MTVGCPCDDETCDDVHAHDVTGTFTLELPPLAQMIGRVSDANNPQFYDATVIAAVNAAAALLNSGFVAVYSGSQPALDGSLTGTQLATATFSATAFPTATASGGTVTATANTITSGTIANTGTAGYMALLKSDGSTVVATGSVGTSGADLNLNTLSFVSGASFAVTAGAITQAQT